MLADRRPPPLEYEHRACGRCGARTEVEAGERCQQTQDVGGDWNCLGGAEEEGFSDGRLRFVSAACIARLDAYYSELMEQEAADAD